MKALKILGVILGIFLVALIIAFFALPQTSHVERSIVVNSTPDVIFKEVNNFKNFNEWSPWASIDPNTSYTYEGPEIGVDSKMSWESDHQDVGNGSQWIVEVQENKMVKSQMDFGGFKGNYYASFVLEPVSEGTKVTWSYDGSEMGFVERMFAPMMDDMLGPQYEKGLASLKSYVESKPIEVQAEVIETDSTEADSTATDSGSE